MPSARRMRLALIGVIAIVVMTLTYTSQLRQSEDPDTRTFGDFYGRTKNGLERLSGGQQQQQKSGFESKASKASKAGKASKVGKTGTNGDSNDDAQLAKKMSERLKAAEQKAKHSANATAPRPDAPAKVVGVGNSAAGQDKSIDKAGNRVAEKETDEDHEVETVMNDILKKSPVIIFSKTYCQFSKRAKALLLDKYSITPLPYVFELDVHELGSQIQARLAKMTGRSTVPNVMINGKSIGGADDIAEMDAKHELAEKIRTLGSVGGKIVEVKERT